MTVKDDIESKLSAERAGRKLGDGLLAVIVDYLVDVVEVKDVNEVVIKDLLEVATDALDTMRRTGCGSSRGVS